MLLKIVWLSTDNERVCSCQFRCSRAANKQNRASGTKPLSKSDSPALNWASSPTTRFWWRTSRFISKRLQYDPTPAQGVVSFDPSSPYCDSYVRWCYNPFTAYSEIAIWRSVTLSLRNIWGPYSYETILRLYIFFSSIRQTKRNSLGELLRAVN